MNHSTRICFRLSLALALTSGQPGSFATDVWDCSDGTGSHAATPVGNFPMSKKGFQSLNVTASLQIWSNGDLNEGWVFIDNADNGADFDSSEARKTRERPKLTVNYTPP